MTKLSGFPADPAAFEHPHDIGFLHDQEFFAIDLHFGARPFAEQNSVARLKIDWNQFAGFVAGAGADGNDLAFLRLFLAVSGIIMPPFDFSSPSTRRRTTRSCRGLNFMGFAL